MGSLCALPKHGGNTLVSEQLLRRGRMGEGWEQRQYSLVRHKDLEGRDEVSQGDGLVALPLLVGLNIVDEDDEVVLSTLVVDLDLLSCALHFDCGLVVVVLGLVGCKSC